MFSVFMELVKRVGIFVIIGQTILHFGISKKYEKYMKLVISFMVAAQIVFAFGIYLKKDAGQESFMSATEYLEEWKRSMSEVEERMEDGRLSALQNLQESLQKAENEEDKSVGWDNNSIKIEKIVIQ